jgi:hypothetical protein
MLSPLAHFLPLGITASTAAFQMWSLAGRVMLDSMTRARADDPA